MGDQFFGDHLLQVYLNDVTILDPFASLHLDHGYFLQVIAHSRTEEGCAAIPFARIQGWCRDFRIAAPSTYGNVYRAGHTMDDSASARLPYHKRDQEIVTSWPDLTVWTKYRVHSMARGRNPPWFPFDDAQIVHPHPNGVQVAILCSVYEGTGASTYALIFNRLISVQAILSSLKCISRCNSEEYNCRTEHNGWHVTLDATITLEEGDFVEVFISSTHFNLDVQPVYVVDTAPRSEQAAKTTPTTTSYSMSLANGSEEEGCRYDCVHRPFVDDPMVLGGASTKYLSLALYTRSFVIFRQAIGSVGHHSPRDVATLSENNQTQDLMQGNHATTVKALNPCTDRMARQHNTIPTSTTHDLILTSSLRMIQPVQAARLDDWNSTFAHLPPPGNGPPEIFNLDSDDESMDDPLDQRAGISIEAALKEPCLQTVDLRDSILLDTLDDWYIGSQRIFISQIHPRKPAIRFKIPFSVNDSSSLLDDWRPGIFQTSFADIPDMHHVGAAFIDAAWPFDLDELVSIDIFVDGSVASNLEDGPVAGFAIVVVGNLNGPYNTGYCMIGYTCGTVSTDPQEHAWMGSDFPSSIEAERSGVCIGLLWALQNPHDTGIPIHLHFDCTSAGFAADGSWKLSAHSLSSLMTRAIGQCAQEVLGSSITFSHIPAHAGIPGNEIADSIAKAAAKQLLPSYTNQLDLRGIVNAVKEHGPYLWLGLGGLLQRRDLPPNLDEGLIVHPENRNLSGETFAPSTRVDHGDTSEQRLLFNICTVNVRSLFEDHDNRTNNRRFLEKGKYLAEQLSWHNYSIVGLQETCSKHQGTSQIGEYVRFCGGCDDKGQLGCEIWIANKVGGTSISAADCVKLHHDPRRLIIRLQTTSFDLCLFALHAPHTGWSTDGIQEWWKDTLRICSLFREGDPLFFIDSNAQIPFAMDPYCGDHGSGNNSVNTDQLLRLCQTLSLWIPSTFESIHPGPTGTWRHPMGSWHRIDYILAPLMWKDAITWSWVDDGIDLNQVTKDHLAVGCQISLLVQRRQSRQHTFDLRQLREPHFQTEVENYLRNSDAIPWETNVHEHAQIVRDQIQEALQHCLPSRRHRPRSSYISDQSWGLRRQKKEYKQKLCRMEELLCTTWILWAFSSWRFREPLVAAYRPHLKWLISYDTFGARVRIVLRQLTAQLKESLHQDRKNFVDHCAQQCAILPLHEAFAQLRKIGIGSSFRKRGSQPLPCFRDRDGELATSVSATAECWRQHCATLEAGEIVTEQQLMWWIQQTNGHRYNHKLEVGQIPSLCDLEHHLRKMKPGKAMGNDGVSSDVCHYCPAGVGRLLWPLLLKEATTLCEPLDHKGGRLVHAYKGRGPKDDPASYRGLMITSVLGKAVRSAFREKFLPCYRKHVGDLHYSARAAGHVGQASMTLQLFCRLAQRVGQSCGMIFLDVRAAYYSVCRELATGFDGTDSQIAHIFKHFQLPPDTMQQLLSLLEGPSAMDQVGADPLHRSLLLELSTGTWFTVRGTSTLTQTHGGSRPGDGLADLLFGYIFNRLLKQLKVKLAEQGLWEDTAHELHQPRTELWYNPVDPDAVPRTIDVVWADDLAIGVRMECPSKTTERVRDIAGALFEACLQYGLRPNTDKGKTEILLQLRGSGSRKVKRQLFDVEDPIITVEHSGGIQQQLHIVSSYKHLGSQIYVGGKLLKEVQVRTAIMKSTFATYGRKVFRNPNIPLPQRGQLLESLIYSILKWNLGAWHELDIMTYNKFYKAIMGLARRTCIAGMGTDAVWESTDARILTELKLSDPQEMLHLARLSFYTTAIHSGPDLLWLLIGAERTWLKQVYAGLSWLHEQLHNSTVFSQLHELEGAWLDGVVNQGPKWRGWIKRAKQHAILQRQNQVNKMTWHANHYDMLVAKGIDMPAPSVQLIDNGKSGTLHACGPCRRIFTTFTAWCTHAHKKHGRIDKIRAFLPDSTCRSCGSDYVTKRRLLAHLHHSTSCAYSHVALTPMGPILPGRNSRGEDVGPALPIPVRRQKRPIKIIADEEEDLAKIRTVFQDRTFVEGLLQKLQAITSEAEMQQPEVVAEEIRALLLSSVVDVCAAWDAVVEAFNNHRWSEVVTEGLQYVITHWSLSWWFHDCQDEVTWPPTSYDTCSLAVAKAHVLLRGDLRARLRSSPKVVVTAARPLSHEMFMIHFYSGTRREGDIQSWLEATPPPEGTILTCLSVDILFHHQFGDLSLETTQQRWLQFMDKADVIAAYIGPPCSTWSVSRWRFYSAGDDGPRPVRLVDEPYGIRSCRLSEIRDLVLGNLLLYFALAVMVLQASLGRIGVLEHPSAVDHGKYPSIWNLDAYKVLQSFDSFTECEIFQGFFGAISPKPTTLGICGLTEPLAILRTFETTSVLPPPLKMGRSSSENGSGTYSTSALKEYPPALCRGLAHLATRWLQLHCRNAEVLPSTNVDRKLVEPFLINYTGLMVRGADTRGGEVRI